MFVRRTNRRENKLHNGQELAQPEDLNKPLTNDLDANLTMVNHIMGYASDIIVRKFTFSSMEVKAAIITIKGLS